MDNKKKYDENSIQVLEGLEAVRKRPGMYIGNVDNAGLHHLIWEIVDNSIDEVLAGHASIINLTLNKDESITISDNGRGIPINIHPKTQKTTVETVFTVLHAGGKFGGENSGYKVSGGLHGVGASVVNALSKYLNVKIFKDGFEYELKFKNGGQDSSNLIKIGPTEKTGTEVRFLPDFSIFNVEKKRFDINQIIERLKQSAYLNKGLEINIIDDRVEEFEKINFKFDGGIVDFIKELNLNSEKITPDVIYAEGEKDSIYVEVSMQYTTSYQPTILSYVNNISTNEGGTHEKGFLDSVIRIINNYVKTNIPKKEQETFTREDIKEGLVAIVSIKHPDPMYEGQTKNKFANPEVRKIVNDLISIQFEKYMLENPSQARSIFSKIKLAAKSRIAALKAKETTRRKDVLGFSTLPGKLADCSSRDKEKTELFIVEGDSAGGSAKMGRNRELQAILPLKGKVINAEKARIDKLFSNDEINSLITALGVDVSTDDNIDIGKLRYGKIIIMTDADVDGSHIRTLLLTFIFRYFKKLIEEKKIYIAQPPLYKIVSGRKERYIYKESEREEYIKSLQEQKYSIQRYKGLGEMNDEQLWDTTMNPENRSLLRVNIEDAAKANLVFTNLMGDLVEPRRDFITKNAKFAKLDI